MLARLLRSALLGVIIGLVLIAVLERTPEGVDLPLAIGGVTLLVVGLGLRRWLLFRRQKERQGEDESKPR